MARRKAKKEAGKTEAGKKESGKILLFGRWSFDDVVVNDPSIAPYICLKPIYVPHTHGRHAKKRFGKANVNIVERLINKLMRSGHSKKRIAGKYIRDRKGCGKKLKMMKVVEQAFEIVEKKTGKNPIQVLVDAVINAGPREDVTKIQMGSVMIPVSCDVSPQRRVDVALRNIALGAFVKSFNNKTSFVEALAEELILASQNDPKSFAIARKEEIERLAEGSR